MKKILSFLLILAAGITVVKAQPQKMTYQAVVRNSNNELVVSQQVGVRVSILEDSVNGQMIYRETHTPMTNINGLITIMIGEGVHPYTNTLDDVKWGKHTHYLSIEIDPAGGTNYTILGTQQIVSVPYSFYSERANYADTTMYAYSVANADTTKFSYTSAKADTAFYTMNVGHANYSDTAIYAYYAGNADSATNAQYADSTRISNHAFTAGAATIAQYADTARTSHFADTTRVADYAHNSGTAAFATNAQYADSTRIANHALTAGVATIAQYADTTRASYFADTTRVSEYAQNAGNATTAKYADSSDYNHLYNRPLGSTTGDILYWNANNSSWCVLQVGHAGEILILDTNNIPSWQADISINVPVLVTDSVINVTQTTAQVIYTVSDDGGSAFVFSGVCWDTAHNPTVLNNHIVYGIGANSYISNLNGLAMGTTYYVRAFAANSVGTVYGNELTFTLMDACNGVDTVVNYDNNIYTTVALGNQCWMRENMRTTYYFDGTTIQQANGTSTTVAYRYRPNNNDNNVATYGYLYNWVAVMNGEVSSSRNPSGVQGICPKGWHVPSLAEWDQLGDFLKSESKYWCGGVSAYIGKSIAAQSGWVSAPNTCTIGASQNDNNTAGLGIYPGGYYNGGYGGFGYYALFWCSTGISNVNAYDMSLDYDNYVILNWSRGKHEGRAVRCLKN